MKNEIVVGIIYGTCICLVGVGIILAITAVPADTYILIGEWAMSHRVPVGSISFVVGVCGLRWVWKND